MSMPILSRLAAQCIDDLITKAHEYDTLSRVRKIEVRAKLSSYRLCIRITNEKIIAFFGTVNSEKMFQMLNKVTFDRVTNTHPSCINEINLFLISKVKEIAMLLQLDVVRIKEDARNRRSLGMGLGLYTYMSYLKHKKIVHEMEKGYTNDLDSDLYTPDMYPVPVDVQRRMAEKCFKETMSNTSPLSVPTAIVAEHMRAKDWTNLFKGMSLSR